MTALCFLAASPVLAACGDDLGGVPRAGTLVYFGSDADVEVIDLGTGGHHTIDVPSGEPTGLALAPDASAVAFIVWGSNLRRHPYRAQLDTWAVLEISPPARGDSIVWGDGFFHYRVRVDGQNGEALVRDGETAARMIADQLVIAPGAPTIAYVDDDRVFVERVDTGARSEVAAGESVRPFLFTHDAAVLLLSVPAGPDDWSHVVRLDLGDGVETDLGPAGSTYAGEGRSPLSPDEAEVVWARHDQIEAVRMDGSGERVIWRASEAFTSPWVLGFTAAGDILYVLEENLTPESDTPEILEHLWLERAGTSELLLDGRRNCNGPVVSGTGALVAWPCEDGTHVISLADGAEILLLSDAGAVVGFDQFDEGVITTTWQMDHVDLHWTSLSGDDELIGSAAMRAPIAFHP